MSLITCRAIVQGKFVTEFESAPLQYVSCPHTQPSWTSNQVFVRNHWSLQSDHQDYQVRHWQAVEDLWVEQSCTQITLLPELEDFEVVARVLKYSHQAKTASERWTLTMYIFLISRCSSVVYCSRLLFIVVWHGSTVYLIGSHGSILSRAWVCPPRWDIWYFLQMGPPDSWFLGSLIQHISTDW